MGYILLLGMFGLPCYILYEGAKTQREIAQLRKEKRRTLIVTEAKKNTSMNSN